MKGKVISRRERKTSQSNRKCEENDRILYEQNINDIMRHCYA